MKDRKAAEKRLRSDRELLKRRMNVLVDIEIGRMNKSRGRTHPVTERGRVLFGVAGMAHRMNALLHRPERHETG